MAGVQLPWWGGTWGWQMAVAGVCVANGVANGVAPGLGAIGLWCCVHCTPFPCQSASAPAAHVTQTSHVPSTYYVVLLLSFSPSALPLPRLSLSCSLTCLPSPLPLTLSFLSPPLLPSRLAQRACKQRLRYTRHTRPMPGRERNGNGNALTRERNRTQHNTARNGTERAPKSEGQAFLRWRET